MQEDAVSVLSQIRGRLAVIGIAGLYRTGKSFLLNRLLGLQAGFELGPSVNPCTKGIWMWSQPVELEADYHCVLIDTEGLGSTQRSASCDMQILSLCVLLSSNFIYNSMGAIDEQAIDELHLVLQLAKHIHARSTDGYEAESASDLAQYFPALFWVLRDFHLRLVDEGGGTMTEKAYLENALRPLPGQEDKNRVRDAIKDLFRSRDCATLVRPVADEGELRHIERLPFESLRPQFQAQVKAFTEKVYTTVRPKMVGGAYVSGDTLAGLASEYCRAINNSAVPTIQAAWTSVVQQQLRACRKKAMQVYQSEIGAAVAEKLPMSEDRLHGLHKAAKAKAMEVFAEPKLDDADPQLLECRAEFVRHIKQLHEDMRRENRDKSKRQCESIAAELYSRQIEKRLSVHGSYGTVEQLMHDWERLREEYASKTGGPAQGEILSTWLFQRMAQSVQQLSDSLQRAAEERCGDLQQKLSEAELHRRRSESVERLLLSVPTVTERHLVPALTEQARRFRKAVASRRANLEAADQFHRDTVSYRWRLDALDAQARAVDAAGGASAAGGIPCAADEAVRRSAALAGSLAEINAQHAAAVEALRGSGPGGAGAPGGRGTTAKLVELAAETYGEIASEARAILSVAPGDEGLRGLRSALRRRRQFWHSQLEEASTAWREAAAQARCSGGEVVRAWSEVAAAAEAVLRGRQKELQPPRPALLQAMAVAAARALEAELLDAPGLDGAERGPSGTCAARAGGVHKGMDISATSEDSQCDSEALLPRARLGLVVRMLRFLQTAEALHRVGEAFLRGSAPVVELLASDPISAESCTTRLQILTDAVVEGATSTAGGALGIAMEAGEHATAGAAVVLIPWLLECLCEAICEAARTGSLRQVRALLELSSALGGRRLAEAVRDGRSRTRVWRGASAVELAATAGHAPVAQLLREWPEGAAARPSGGASMGCLPPFRAPGCSAAGALRARTQQRPRQPQPSLGRRVKSALSAAMGCVGPPRPRAYGALGA